MVGNMIPLRFGGELPSYRYVYIYLKVFQHGNEKSANSISHFLSTYRCNFPSNKHEYIQDYSSKASIDIVTQFNPFSTHLQRHRAQVFPEGLDLIAAIAWWRKRIPVAAPGTAKAAQRAVAFGVFEGSFNAQAHGMAWDRLGSEKLGESWEEKLDGLNV